MTGNSREVSLPCNRSADALLPNPRRVSKVIHTDESRPESRVSILSWVIRHRPSYLGFLILASIVVLYTHILGHL